MPNQEGAEFDYLFRNSKGKVKDAPVIEGLVADTHCHLDMLQNPELALARCAYHNVTYVVTCVESSQQPQTTYDMLAQWLAEADGILDSWGSRALLPHCNVVAGCHPQLSLNYDKEVESITRACAMHPLTVAIGEIGLDYYYDNAPHDVQKDVFKRQIELAKQVDKPILMHIRDFEGTDAHDEALEILKSEGVPPAGAILHCFTNGPEVMRQYLDLGCYIAFGGAVTFAHSDLIRQSALEAPLNRIITETDSPYMAPVPLRGTPCSPEDTVFTVDFLANLRGVSEEDRPGFFATLYQNAHDVFHIESHM